MINPLRRMFAKRASAPSETRVFAAPEGVRIYAVGDVHGRSALLSSMMEAIARDVASKPPAQIIEVYLGDYIDRGMQSREVIDLLIAPPPEGHERVCLMGNHEEALLHFLRDPKVLREWASFGGYATLASYGIPIPESMSPEKLAIIRNVLKQNLPIAHETFLRNLPMTYVSGDYLFVHAGILPNLPLAAQKPKHLLWIRDAFLSHNDYFDYYVVHGHTPVTAADIRFNRANLDVSAAALNSLCCLIIDGDEREVLLVTSEKD